MSQNGSKSQLVESGSKTVSKVNLKKTASRSINQSKSGLAGSVKNLSKSNALLVPVDAPNLNEILIPAASLPAVAKGPASDYYHNQELKGIFPLFLTGASQTIAKVVIDFDVSEEKMFRMIPKSDLMQDMATRLAISDFTPAKQHILAYPGEEMMLHYDPVYRYTQNFFLVIDAATADSILNVRFLSDHKPIDRNKSTEGGADVEEVGVAKMERPKKWKSLGSEKEIEMELVKDLDLPVRIEISRKYGEFNAPYSFGDRDAADAFLEIKSYKDLNFEINRLEIQAGVQVENCIVTKRRYLISSQTMRKQYGFARLISVANTKLLRWTVWKRMKFNSQRHWKNSSWAYQQNLKSTSNKMK
jgi:hypothetical protein